MLNRGFARAQSFLGTGSDDDDPEAPLLEAALKFVVTAPGGIIVREGPDTKAKRTDKVLERGETFEVDDIVTLVGKQMQHWENRPADSICFLRLKNGEGWAIDKNIVTEENLVEEHDPDNMSGWEMCRFKLRLHFQGKVYEYLILMIILLNAVLIGLEIDNEGALAHHYWIIINTVFAVIYLLEIFGKFVAFGLFEFFSSNWNIFDLIVTTITVAGDVHMVLQYCTGHSNGETSVVLAIIPVLRLLRLLRMARLIFELRLLVNSFVGSIAALAWIAVFAVLWFYICGCVGTVFLGRKEMLADGDVDDAAALRKKFATIPMSMFTLFEVMTLEAFTEVVSPLVKHRPYLLIFFLVFVFVTAFFLLNLVTAVVVKRTMVAQKELKQSQDEVKEDERETQIVEMYSAFLRQNNENDIIKVQNFYKFQEDEEVQKAMSHLDWDAKFLNSTIVMVDHNKAEDEVSLKEMRDLWVTSEQPLNTTTLLHCQLQMARRLEMQEKLCIELLEQQKLCAKLLEKLEAGGSVMGSKV